jgi:uncharacterized membrane protein YqiK
MTPVYLVGIVVVVGALIAFGTTVLFARFYRKVEQGKALIVNKMKAEPEVTFTGMVVLPIFHKSEIMDISVKTLEIDRRGKEGLICRDNIRADIKVTFFVRVNKTQEDVIKVAQAIGCMRASDPSTLDELFNAKFSEALKTVGKQLDFVDLYTKRNEFRDHIVEVIGRDLNGYVLEDAAIDYLEQTPLSSLDPNNILDAQGIRKITELTAVEHVKTNEFQNTERKNIKKQDVEAAEAIFALERQQAEAKAKQQREIDTVLAREAAETAKVQSEERLKSENARLKVEQELGIYQENQTREIEVAKKNRERIVAVENERVEKDRMLEVINRERDVELQRIAKEKEVEKQRKEIADVIRERIVVEKTVAEQEEKIKEVRLLEEARRTKEALIVTAEGEAQEKLVKDIKAAEAAEQASRFIARERLTLADAELEAADKTAKAKMRLAEGLQAEAAAAGLAQVKVKEADAIATEKLGLAEASVLREKGMADAVVRRERSNIESDAIKSKYVAESEGLELKAAAMKAMDGVGREHEEFRLKLESERMVELKEIEARQAVAASQAQVLSTALQNARIDIVGGETVIFDKIAGAVAMGRSVDGLVGRSDTLQHVLGDYTNGKRDLVQDIKDVLTTSSLSTADLQNMSVAAFLAMLMTHSDGEGRKQLSKLADTAKHLGVDGMKAGS